MPLLDLQRRLRELGRIRTGVQKPVAGRKGVTRPAKLDTFRLTSPSEHLITAAAELYGGTPAPWEGAPGEGAQWEVITEADALEAFVPPASTLSQFYEMWSGGGCIRRCDGETELTGDRACMCPDDPMERRDLAAKGQACKPTTRLSLILPLLPDIGVWRLESHGYYAAIELAAAQEICAMATSRGYQIPVRLRLDQREVKRPGKPTNRFSVPVLELGATLGNLYAALGIGASEILVAPLGTPELASADERLRQLPPANGAHGGRAALGDGLGAVENGGGALRTATRTGAQRRSAALPGGPPPIGDGAFGPDMPGADLGASAPVPPKAEAEEEPEPIPLGKPTEPMMRKLFALVNDLGWDDDERKRRGVASFKDITFEQANALIDQWERLAQDSSADTPAYGEGASGSAEDGPDGSGASASDPPALTLVNGDDVTELDVLNHFKGNRSAATKASVKLHGKPLAQCNAAERKALIS